MNLANRYSLLSFLGSFLAIVAAVTNLATNNQHSPLLLTVMISGMVFSGVMLIASRIQRHRSRRGK